MEGLISTGQVLYWERGVGWCMSGQLCGAVERLQFRLRCTVRRKMSFRVLEGDNGDHI